MSSCKIFASEKMIIGRWYKLVTYPQGFDDNFPFKYTVNYSCNSDLVTLLHDTVYIKQVGTFTISCVDMYGSTDSITIEAIEEPKIERTVHEITPTSFEDLQNKINQIGENAYINIPNGVYNFELTDSTYTIPEGVILDFNDSIVNLTSSVIEFRGFNLMYDYSGIKNVNFIGVNMYQVDTYKNTSTIITTYSGYNCIIENITFRNTVGFNIAIGSWATWNNTDMYDKRHYGKWSTVYADIINGYISDDGTVIENTECWTHTEPVNIYDSEDRSYFVGRSNMYIPTTARMYDIAFYDENKNLLEIKRDCQYYRKYYYPKEAAYVRFAVWQTNKPTEAQPRDDYGVMRMMAGITGYKKALICEELTISNIRAYNSSSGILSVVGACTDIHMDRICISENGWSNNWGFDIEDCWNSVCGCVITHSYLAKVTTIFYGVQGVTFMSSVCGRLNLNNNVHFTTLINSIVTTIQNIGSRCNVTLINSYYSGQSTGTDASIFYSFGDLDSKIDKECRTVVDYYLIKNS